MRKSFASIYSAIIPFAVEKDSFHVKREYLSSETIDFDGRPIKSSCYKVDDPTTRYKGLKGVDFALENQLAVGANMPPIKCNLSTLEILKSIPNE